MWVLYDAKTFEIVHRYSDEVCEKLNISMPGFNDNDFYQGSAIRVGKITFESEDEWRMWKILNKKED